jgi:hypothetical protein
VNSDFTIPKIVAVKMFIYSADGNKLIYKFGDPDGNKQIGFEMEMNNDYSQAQSIYEAVPQHYLQSQEVVIRLRP